MTSLFLSQNNYTHCGLALRLAKCLITPEGISVTSAPNGSSIKTFLEQQYGPRCFQFAPTPKTAKELVEYHRSSLGQIPVSLGARDTNEFVLSHPHFQHLSPSNRRVRQLDSYFPSGSYRIDMLHLTGHKDAISSALEGAEYTLSRHRPLTIIEMAETECVNDIQSYLSKFKYRLFDSFLQPITTASDSLLEQLLVGSETLFIAIPLELLNNNLIERFFAMRLTSSHNVRAFEQELARGLLIEARQGGVKFERPDAQNLTYKFDEALICDGLYACEQNDNYTWRWLGPKPRASISLPRPAIGRYELTVNIIGYAQEIALQEVRLFLMGKLVQTEIMQEHGLVKLKGNIEVDVDYPSAALELVITVPKTYCPNEYDSRRLGVCLSQIVLSPR